MEKIIIDLKEYTINYQETKIGDKIVDKNNNSIYEASIADADDINWVIVNAMVSVEDALAFAEYFHNNFDYYDCNANGRVYKWIDATCGQSAMTMKQIFDYWQTEHEQRT